MREFPAFARLPRHVGMIPDGNRRWARQRGLHPAEGYAAGLVKGIQMLGEFKELGIEEVSIYGFTKDNAKRPRDQREAFTAACVGFAQATRIQGVALRVVGDHSSPVFPRELLPFVFSRQGEGPLKVNMLVNYGWDWDLETAARARAEGQAEARFAESLASADVSRIDMVVRWGGMRRLSGFLPVQTVYADFYVIDALWPDWEPEQLYEALRWYARQDVTLGG